MFSRPALYLSALVALSSASGRTVVFDGVADDDSLDTEVENAHRFNDTIQSLVDGDTMVILNRTYHLMGGISATELKGVTIRLDGTISFSKHIEHWPKSPDGSVLACLSFRYASTHARECAHVQKHEFQPVQFSYAH